MLERRLQLIIVLLVMFMIVFSLIKHQQLQGLVASEAVKGPLKSTPVDRSELEVFAVPPIDDPSQAERLKLVKEHGFNLDKVATLMETRPDARLPILINSFTTQIASDWLFRLFLSKEAIEVVMRNDTIVEHTKTGKITIIPINHDFKHPGPPIVTVSNWMKQRTYWENFSPATWVFVFQLDSALCTPPTTGKFARPNEVRKKIEDYFRFDYIGAPLDCKGEGPGECDFNGGLSLRRRSYILDVIDNHMDKTDEWDAEDRFFVRIMRLMGANLPTREEAAGFSVQVEAPKRETYFGIHQVWKEMHDRGPEKDKVEREMIERCPEYMIAGPNEIL